MTNLNIFCLIIRKFNYRKKFSLFVLLIIDENLKINFYKMILLLSSTINLELESNEIFYLDF